MKPAPFRYHRPETLDETLALLAEIGDDAAVLAGGQSLVPVLALRLASPAHVVDVNRVPGLDVIAANGSLALGALVRQQAACVAQAVRSSQPLLAEALPLVGHRETRGRGTVVGSLAHADPAAELPTVAVALDAEIALASCRGVRTVPAAEFFLAPFMTARAPDELVTEVRFPAWPAGAGHAFLEFARRSHDFALAAVAVLLQLDADGAVAGARLAFAGVGSTPVRADGAEDALHGQPAGEESFRAAAEAAVAVLDPPSDVLASAAYRRHVARVLLIRALRQAAERAREERA